MHHWRYMKRVATIASAALAVAGMTVAVGASAQADESPAPAAADSHQWLTGYWHNFDNGSTVMKLSEVPSAYNLIAVAFADNHSDLSGGITFNLESEELDGYTEREFKDDIADIQEDGRKVIISVGGEKGNVVIDDATAAENFADTTYELMEEYGFDGVDIDLEHGINAEYTSDALHQLRDKAGSDLIITMAPQTIDYQYTSAPYYELTENISDILTIVNMQYYNSGSMAGCDDQIYSQGTPDFLAALACIQLEMDLRPDQVGLGVPAVPDAAGGGYQPMSDVVKAVDCLELGENCGNFEPEEAYGPIGGVMTWSINWDKTNNYELAEVFSERLNIDGDWSAPDPGDGNDDDGSDQDGSDENGSDENGDANECSDIAAWDSGEIYTGGEEVSHDGDVWEAKWWTQGDAPGEGGEWGVWQNQGSCD